MRGDRFGGLVASCALVAALIAASSAAANMSSSGRPQRERLVVMLRPGVSPASLPGARSVRLLSRALNAYLVSPRSASAAADWRARGVTAMQPNTVFRRSIETTVCTSPPTTPDYLLSSVDAADVSLPSTTPPIAFLDSGLSAAPVQFGGRVRSPTDVVTHSGDASDDNGHGTAVAAVAAGADPNDRGVSPSSPVIPIKVFGPDGSATAADVVAGIGASISDGAGVINISGASPLSGAAPNDNAVVKQAIDMAFSRGIVVVAASGNEGSSSPDVPAADPHVISVGAIGESGLRATFSNFGLTLDLVAPGVQLTEPAPLSICPSGYQLVDGTSFAAPAVAGAAALLEAQRPALSASQRFEILRTSARTLSLPGWNQFTGFGELDVAGVLKSAVPAPDPGEVDDDAYWVTGARGAAHPPLLSARRHRATTMASVEPRKDPTDVYRLVLSRGERVSATVSTAAGAVVQLGVWSPRTGAFEISSGRAKHRVATQRVSVQGSLTYTARRAGAYFLSVSAQRTLPGGAAYTLTVRGR